MNGPSGYPLEEDSKNLNTYYPTDYRVVVEDGSIEPEIALWKSVVMQAISDALDPILKQDIMTWIIEEDFELVASLANLDAGKLGRRLACIALAKRPNSIVMANRLKSDIYWGAIRIS